MNEQEQILINQTKDKPVIIWGSRMTGIGFLRFAEKHNIKVLGFVDSDKSLHTKKIGKYSIYSPETIAEFKQQNPGLMIIVAVAIKQDEILKTLTTKGVQEQEIINYNDLFGTMFTIDVSGTCNLRCPSCAHAMDESMKPVKGFMSLDDFKQVIAKIKSEVPIISHISLYSWGEPFLHPQLEKLIKHAHSEGIATAVSTNFSISNSNRVNTIIESNPDYLKISTSGYYPEAYNSTHTGGNVHLVASNLYRLRYLIDKKKLSTFVDVNYHVYKNNFGEDQRKMQELCDELGFALSLTYANLTPIERLVDYCEGHADDETKKIADLLLVSVEEGLEATKEARSMPCRFLTNQVNINWDRTVPICCVTFDRKTSIIEQDFLKTPLNEINKKKDNHPTCVKCTKFGFHSYLLGTNQKGWDEFANKTKKKVLEGGYDEPTRTQKEINL